MISNGKGEKDGTTRKYPRTLHLPQSLSVTSDDKVHKSLDQFEGKEVIITEKLDGDCLPGEMVFKMKYCFIKVYDVNSDGSPNYSKSIVLKVTEKIFLKIKEALDNVKIQK